MSYRYGPHALRSCPEQPAETLYVIGGLYGNLPALSAILAMAAREAAPVTLCFNGDFNWFMRASKQPRLVILALSSESFMDRAIAPEWRILETHPNP